jgi:hypothetical protein
MVGAMISTPIVEMEKMGEQALSEKRSTMVLIQTYKSLFMPSHKM